ncbi:MAG TPA: hemerythrin domain-containing protein [Burkholderiales bacterium]|nr:hemerythrin domain-containing protein [Burkholderiales bacterium]
MSAVLQKASHSSATDMIRADHSRVLSAFHRYDPSARPAIQRALVETICLALDIHAELEEEILYPAARDTGEPTVDKSISEHAEMRRLISRLRASDPAGAEFEPALMELMAVVIHHVADEETRILPALDRLPRETLRDLAARLSKRRGQLMMQNFSAMATNKVRAAPGVGVAVAVAGVVALIALGQAARRR